MSLTDDIYKSFVELFGGADITNDQKATLKKLSSNLAKGISNWVVKQPFRIQKMKAVTEMESIETAGVSFADVLPLVQTTVPPGQTTIGMSVSGGPTKGQVDSPIIAQVTMGKQGVQLPKLSLKKLGGQGGPMKSKGYSYIGDNPVGLSNPEQTEVRLSKKDIKDL